MSPHWSSADGGALDLFSTNSEGLPNAVVKSLLPTNNSFAFFPVGEKSFHQVAEVTSRVGRLSHVLLFHRLFLLHFSFLLYALLCYEGIIVDDRPVGQYVGPAALLHALSSGFRSD